MNKEEKAFWEIFHFGQYVISVDQWSDTFTEHMAVRGKSAHSAGLWSIANVWTNLAILPSQGNTAGSRRWVCHPYVTYQQKYL